MAALPYQLWMQPTAAHEQYSRHMSINEIWSRFAITPRDGKTKMHATGDSALASWNSPTKAMTMDFYV